MPFVRIAGAQGDSPPPKAATAKNPAAVGARWRVRRQRAGRSTVNSELPSAVPLWQGHPSGADGSERPLRRRGKRRGHLHRQQHGVVDVFSNGSRHFLDVRPRRAISGIGQEGNEARTCSAIGRPLTRSFWWNADRSSCAPRQAMWTSSWCSSAATAASRRARCRTQGPRGTGQQTASDRVSDTHRLTSSFRHASNVRLTVGQEGILQNGV